VVPPPVFVLVLSELPPLPHATTKTAAITNKKPGIRRIMPRR
jgi:hypothetical protein